jgi:hypothetical protein
MNGSDPNDWFLRSSFVREITAKWIASAATNRTGSFVPSRIQSAELG